MKYKIYTPYAQFLRRVIKENLSNDKLLLKQFNKISIWDTIGFLESNNHKISSYLSNYMRNWCNSEVNLTNYLAEHYWNQYQLEKSLIIYPETHHLIKVIEKSKIKHCDFNQFDRKAFILAMPEQSIYNSCLIMYCDFRDFIRGSEYLLNQWKTKLTANYSDEKLFYVLVNQKKSAKEFIYFLSSVDFHQLADICGETDNQLLQKFITQRQMPSSEKINSDDSYMNAKVVKLCVTFFAYQALYPEKLRTGTPVNIRATKNQSLGKIQTTPLISTDNPQNDILEPTPVGFHQRILRHDRYYRSDEWRDKKRGTRIIDVTPHTRLGKDKTLR